MAVSRMSGVAFASICEQVRRRAAFYGCRSIWWISAVGIDRHTRSSSVAERGLPPLSNVQSPCACGTIGRTPSGFDGFGHVRGPLAPRACRTSSLSKPVP